MKRAVGVKHPSVSRGFHPLVYKAAAGLVAWFVVAAWVLFDRQRDTELPLVMVSVLLLIAILIPYSLWRVWRRDQEPRSVRENAGTFSDWAFGQVQVWQSQLKGTDAMIDMLLPLAAVAFGLTALGIVFVLSG
jgi:hypothetical protein